jgi:hypothetical protein
MIRVQDISALIYFGFMLVYFAIGNPDDNSWSGLFFCMNYIFILWTIIVKPTKIIRRVSILLALSLLVFSILKYFIFNNIERQMVFVLFLIAVVINVYLQLKKKA